jgi:hypothetical protein
MSLNLILLILCINNGFNLTNFSIVFCSNAELKFGHTLKCLETILYYCDIAQNLNRIVWLIILGGVRVY